MRVTFTKTGVKRYRVSVEGKGVIASYMEPAAGYDDRLPHDLAHFVVENMLGITGCVFGPLAAGGSRFTPIDGSKRERVKRGSTSKQLDQREAERTERIIDIAAHRWTNRAYTGAHVKGVSPADIDRICTEFDRVSARWSQLPVGGSMTLDWTATGKPSR